MLVLEADSVIDGYWSDGTADVTVSVTLRNDGNLRVGAPQTITSICIPATDALEGCHREITLTLPDGYHPASEKFTVRAPMGVTTVVFNYNGDQSLTLDVEVPERILGVARDLWECYSHRPSQGTAVNGEWLDGCGGWKSPTVRKWLSDVPVKVWATGEPAYVDIFETVLAGLGPTLDLEFEWVGSEDEADFRAYVGIQRSDAPDLGFKPESTEWGGFAGSSPRNGETTSAYMVVWHLDPEGFRSPTDRIRAITLHEAAHALVPVGHNTRPASGIDGAGLTVPSPRDLELIRLNSHRLVRPGMTMEEVRQVIVLDDELLDAPRVTIEQREPLELIWRAYVALAEADSASFRLSGGWIDRKCGFTFGVRRGPIEMTIGDFGLFKDDPALILLNLQPTQFFIRYSLKDREWRHWQLSGDGTWQQVERQVLVDASSWWLWHGKLLRTLRSLIMDGIPEGAVVEETADGNLTVQATLEPSSHVNMWDWNKKVAVDFTLVLDRETAVTEGYTWEARYDPVARAGSCLVYREVATDGQIGVEIAVPQAIQNELNGAGD